MHWTYYTVLVNAQNSYNNLLVTSTGDRAVDIAYKTLWEIASSEVKRLLEKVVVSYSNNKILQAWSMLLCIWKQTIGFLFHYFLATDAQLTPK